MAATWQDRWSVPGAAMVTAAFILYSYVFDTSARSSNPTKIVVSVNEPKQVVVDRNLRDPIMIGNEWDAVLVNRSKLINDRKAAAEEAREEEKRRKEEADDEEYFKRTGKRREREKKGRKGLPGATSNTTVTRRPKVPPPPPPPPAFKVHGVVISGATKTAVVNDRTVTIGDVVQGFRVDDLSLDVITLTGTVAPWKDKRLKIDTRPPPSGIKFLSEGETRALQLTRGKLRPSTGGSPRPVTVLPTIVGDPEAPRPAPSDAPPAAPSGPPPDNRPWWQRVMGDGSRPSPAPEPSPSARPWWTGFGRPGNESHPLEDKPRSR
jgi:hypothetical protein